MLTKTRAIVLHSLKYGDKKLFVTMFSREFGMITFSSSTGGKGRANNKTNYFQPLNQLEVEFDQKPKASIQTLKDVRIDYPASSIPFNPYKLSISLFLAEFMRYALMNEQKDCNLYDYIAQSIEWLDTAEKGFANFHLIFMVKLSQFIGFYPNTENYHQGSWFDLNEGTFSSLMPEHKEILRPSDAAIVPLLSRLSFSSMHLLKLSRKERNACTDAIIKYYNLHLPHFPELKSFNILKELFI